MITIRIVRLRMDICLFACVIALLLCGKFSARGEDVPLITGFVRTNSANCSILYTNCNDTNFDYLLQSSTNLTDWVDVRALRGAATNTTVNTSVTTLKEQSFYRVVKTPHINVPIFLMAILVSSNINFNGNSVLVDSFDSSDTNHSTGGQYDVTKQSDHGDVGSDLALTGSVNLGNAAIYGRIHTGPGSFNVNGAVALGPSGSVGDLAFQASGLKGFQSGSWFSDMNMTFPSVSAPTTPSVVPTSGQYQGTSYDYLLVDGYYIMNSALAGKVMVIGTNTVLWTRGGVNLTGVNSGIFLAPGASLALYVGDSSGAAVTATFGSTFSANTNGYARNLQVYCLPTCTSIVASNARQFCGTIYAPQADFTESGGGTTATQFYGSLIARSVTVNSHFQFHFDEDLKVNGPFR